METQVWLKLGGHTCPCSLCSKEKQTVWPVCGRGVGGDSRGDRGRRQKSVTYTADTKSARPAHRYEKIGLVRFSEKVNRRKPLSGCRFS